MLLVADDSLFDANISYYDLFKLGNTMFFNKIDTCNEHHHDIFGKYIKINSVDVRIFL